MSLLFRQERVLVSKERENITWPVHTKKGTYPNRGKPELGNRGSGEIFLQEPYQGGEIDRLRD